MARAPARRVLYALATSDRFEGLVRSNRWLERRAYRAARRYVAGESLEDAIQTIDRLRREGFAVSLDLFGESVTEPAALDRVVAGYRRAADALRGYGAEVFFEVVPSHVGIDVSVDACRRHLERIIEALPEGSRLRVSAEESWRTDRVLELTMVLAREGAPVMPTLQANLRRSADDASQLAAAGLPVRLVKGAYPEPPDVAYAWGEETDLAYVRLAHALHAGGSDVALGTHDPVLREALLMGMPGVSVEMLLGVRREDARHLVRRGHAVRIYVPFGREWFRYWMRRLAESQRR